MLQDAEFPSETFHPTFHDVFSWSHSPLRHSFNHEAGRSDFFFSACLTITARSSDSPLPGIPKRRPISLRLFRFFTSNLDEARCRPPAFLPRCACLHSSLRNFTIFDAPKAPVTGALGPFFLPTFFFFFLGGTPTSDDLRVAVPSLFFLFFSLEIFNGRSPKSFRSLLPPPLGTCFISP